MANSKITPALYASIAEAYALIEEALSSVEAQALQGINAIVDVATSYDDSADIPAGTALEIELALLGTFNNAYLSSQGVAGSTTSYLAAVRAINNLVIAGSDLSTTSTDVQKLDDFIITESLATFTNGCIPEGWSNLCESAGYNVDGWASYVCS